ncbi:MAG: sulfotransferase [Frankiales bacterium]|nr:sulfotransferase [Frankiales bacterium]
MKQLPDWAILGAPRAGTTTLASWLNRHPEGFVPPAKEVSYFDLYFDRGPQWYADQFSGATQRQRWGDATPGYLYSEIALDRLALAAPQARLIVLLREPAERVWSHYTYNRALGLEPRSLARALAAERRDPTNAPWRLPIGYLGCSRYARRLESVVRRFDREQLLVLMFDDLRRDPTATFAAACRHLGIDSSVAPPDAEAHNAGRLPRSALAQHGLMRVRAGRLPWHLGPRLARLNTKPGGYPPMPADVAADLKAEFAGDNRALVRWLGRELPAGWVT